jgi:5-methylcytosine-specific restriction endonuclease McrA
MRAFGNKQREELGESYYRQFRAGAYERAKNHPAGPPRKRWPEMYRAGDQLRRARKLGATVEEFKCEEIYERDGWVCQLCDSDVDPELKWPESMSASLDHIIPLSKGGEHSRANSQLAHLKCNVDKGARI